MDDKKVFELKRLELAYNKQLLLMFGVIEAIDHMTMTATATLERADTLVSALGLDDSFQPQEPTTTKDTGLSETLIEDLVLKFLSGVGSESGRAISDNLCLPMAILEDRFDALRQRQEIAPTRRPCWATTFTG